MTDVLPSLLAALPDSVVRDVEQALANGAVIVEPELGLREFRRDPPVALARVSSRLRDLWRTAPPPGRVVWCLSGDAATGLDAFELAAVLGRFMHIERLRQASAGAEKHVVAIGTLREENVGVSLVAPQRASAESLVEWVSELTRVAAPVLVFVTAEDASRMTVHPCARDVAGAFLVRGGAFGILVPADSTAEAFANPGAQIAAVERLAGERPAFVRFEAAEALGAPGLHEFMGRSGLRCDTSFAVRGDDTEPTDAPARRGPFTRTAPYHPQPFDLRVPLARVDESAWFELPAQPASSATIADWWTRQLGPSDDALAPLLDAARMEAFYRLSRLRFSEERRYPEVRVYNWPSPAPASRVTLLDGGEMRAEAAGELLGAVSRLAAEAGPRMHLANPENLLRLAEREVLARYSTSPEEIITLQGEAHRYLAELPHEAPLREDYADFARFVPATLGHALELGSGYGVLAWALAPRAKRYTCLDLDRRMFETLRPDLHQSGVVADMHRLPFADGTFDSVVANNVLEHLYDPLGGLTEVCRVLRPGGRLLALVPFDALNNRHELPAHHWKVDEPGLKSALQAAGFHIDRLQVVSLYDLGVPGAFPTCFGLEAKFDAVKPGGRSSIAPPSTPASSSRSAASAGSNGLPGRLLPGVREIVGFERWDRRRVLAVGSEPSDVDEFLHFGANVSRIAPETIRWPAPDASVDLVYSFLTLPRAPIAVVAAEMCRVLAPGGVVVAGFRNRAGLRYLARVQSYFAEACDLRELIGPDALVQLADDDGARSDDEYVSADDVEKAFAGFGARSVTVRNLTPDDLPGIDPAAYVRKFWQWLAGVCGRFVLVRAVK